MALPNYISWTGHGSSCGEPPGVFTGATMHLFGLKADRNTMQALVDKFLNPVAGLGRNYQVAVDRALLTFVDIEKGTTATEVVGWLPGQECALWIPIVETEVLPPHLRLVMWSPYIFISYGIGMATGREVWGWSKAMGDFKFPAPGDAAPKFQLDTVIFRKFDVTKQGGSEPLLKVTGDAALNTNSTWANLSDAVTELLAGLIGVPAPLIPSAASGVFEFPAIALKQIRDSQLPHLACYQALVNSPVRVKQFGGGGLHGAKFTLEVATCDSHPIVVKLLGANAPTPSTQIPVEWAGWVKFDFDAAAGSVISETT